MCVCVCLFAFAHAWPQVYEAVRCHRECSQYEWKTESWSICTINTVDDLPACGEGVQSRKIRSVSRSFWADSEPGTALHTGRSRLATIPGTHAGPDTHYSFLNTSVWFYLSVYLLPCLFRDTQNSHSGKQCWHITCIIRSGQSQIWDSYIALYSLSITLFARQSYTQMNLKYPLFSPFLFE